MTKGAESSLQCLRVVGNIGAPESSACGQAGARVGEGHGEATEGGRPHGRVLRRSVVMATASQPLCYAPPLLCSLQEGVQGWREGETATTLFCTADFAGSYQ